MPNLLVGIHDREGRHILPPGGWCVDVVALSDSPPPTDYVSLRAEINWIVRLNWGYGSTGTIPLPHDYEKMAAACPQYVAGSPGIQRVIIGNEPNHENERPNGVFITPADYARCFLMCRDAIKRFSPHVQVIPAPCAPYHANPVSWLDYLREMLATIAANGGCDGIAIHAYTRSSDPYDINDNDIRMGPPLEGQFAGFLTYMDALEAVPSALRHLPAYITEFNELLPHGWDDANTGVVQAAYRSIHGHNREPDTQKFQCLVLYRWPRYDQWYIEGKQGVIDDFRAAVALGYQSPNLAPQNNAQNYSSELFIPSISTGGESGGSPALPPRVWDARLDDRGVTIETPAVAPGQPFWRVVAARWYNEQEADGIGPDRHILAEVLDSAGKRVGPGLPLLVEWPSGHTLIYTEAKPQDPWAANYGMSKSLHEYSIRVNDALAPSETVKGIGMGADGNSGIHTSTFVTFRLVTAPAGATPTPPQPSSAVGYVIAPAGANLRAEPSTDAAILSAIPYGEQVRLLGVGDGWFRVQAGDAAGWVAANLIGLEAPAPLPNRDEPVPLLAHPVGNPLYRTISQPFGARPEYYAQFRVDGVPLRGHEGIDFATPLGTPVAAVDGGVAAEVGDEGQMGYGRYIKLVHTWGESVYAHLKVQTINAGERVNKGQVIARSGNTGNSDGPHLHFGLRVNPYDRADGWGGYIDPARYLVNSAPAPAQPATSQREIVKAITAAALEFDVDPDLLLSQAWAESSFNPRAVSPAGAMGLLQIMDATWVEWSPKIGAGDDPLDARQNARVGAAYMRWLLQQTRGNTHQALIAYGWGIGNLLQRAREIPPALWVEYANKIIHGRDLLKAVGA